LDVVGFWNAKIVNVAHDELLQLRHLGSALVEYDVALFKKWIGILAATKQALLVLVV
jgi:hypothetical protein